MNRTRPARQFVTLVRTMLRLNPRPRPDPWSKFRERIPHRALTPFFWLEWILEWPAHALSNWVFLEVLEYLGTFSVLVAVIFYFADAPNRTRLKHYQAWQVINTAQGKGGSGGRIEALQELNRDHVSLVGVDAAGAFLMGVHLEKAPLLRSNFEAADLRNSNLSQADLTYSNLKGANLRDSDLRNVDLDYANLEDADLEASNLSGARLTAANLTAADLRNSDLLDLKWTAIASIKLANVFNVKNPPPGFIDWALGKGAVSIESDEEWEKLTNAPR
jgi:uncharacterized protein YjbI with pentapeptide repeats